MSNVLELPPVDPALVMNALMEEDTERLRLRRSRGAGHAGGDHDGRFGNNGLAREDDLGLGMVAKEVKDDVLPLKSGFFDWAIEYFREPQMKASRDDSATDASADFQAPDADEPGSTTYNQQAWRHLRNEDLVERSRANEVYAGASVFRP
jgi:regulator-associated protein of mTOR